MTLNRSWFSDHRSQLCQGLIMAAVVGWLIGPAVDATQAAEPMPSDERARQYFTDEPVVDQDGRSHRFYSDLLAGHTVLIHAFYTHCREACPLQVDRLRLVRARLGSVFGSTVRFLSLSVDVAHDQSAQLKAFAHRHGADEPGWYFLSGHPVRFSIVLKQLGLWTDDPSDHQTLFIVGRPATKHWKKLRPDASPEEVAQALIQLADE